MDWAGGDSCGAAGAGPRRGDVPAARDSRVHWELENLGELVAKANQQPRPDFAELAMVVARCAEDGDALAASVLERAGEELAEQVSLAAVRCVRRDAQRTMRSTWRLRAACWGRLRGCGEAMEEHLHMAMPEAVGGADGSGAAGRRAVEGAERAGIRV